MLYLYSLKIKFKLCLNNYILFLVIKRKMQTKILLFYKLKCVEIGWKASFQTEASLVCCLAFTIPLAVVLSCACRFCFCFPFFSPPFSTFLSLKHRHHLSLPGDFWSVRTPWHSGSGIRAQLLLHGFLKSPSLSAAWYVLSLESASQDVPESVFGVSWIAHTWVHVACFALCFFLCLLPACAGVCSHK